MARERVVQSSHRAFDVRVIQRIRRRRRCRAFEEHKCFFSERVDVEIGADDAGRALRSNDGVLDEILPHPISQLYVTHINAFCGRYAKGDRPCDRAVGRRGIVEHVSQDVGVSDGASTGVVGEIDCNLESTAHVSRGGIETRNDDDFFGVNGGFVAAEHGVCETRHGSREERKQSGVRESSV